MSYLRQICFITFAGRDQSLFAGQFEQLVEVGREIERSSPFEVLGANVVRVQLDFNTTVADTSDIVPVITVTHERNDRLFEQQLFGDGIVAFQSQADTVVQCAEVDTGVVFVRLFPSDVMVTFGRGSLTQSGDQCACAATQRIVAGVKQIIIRVGRNIIVTRHTKAGTQLQHIQPAYAFQEGFFRSTPSE